MRNFLMKDGLLSKEIHKLFSDIACYKPKLGFWAILDFGKTATPQLV